MTPFDVKCPTCTFCGKSHKSAKKVIVSPECRAGICDECVNLCLLLLIEEEVFGPQPRQMVPEDIGLGYSL